jgi:exosortase/archaeosortase family protein
LDFRLISWLQSSTSRMASLLLDVLDILHLMEGNVLVLPGHRMLVDEACSGVNSVLVLLVLTALFVVSARRPLLWSAILLASSIAWAWAGNTVRVATIAIAQAWWDLDLSSGWQHELLGYVTISLALVWLASTDCLLMFVLWPIVLRSANVPEFALQRNPLTRAWNWCVGAKEQAGKVRERKQSEATAGSGQPVAGSLPPQDAAGGATRRQAVCWLTAFGILGLFQVVAFAVPNRTADAAADDGEIGARFQQADLPEKLGGWTLVGYELAEREPGDELGHFSNKWRFRRGTVECLVSIDYPFFGWHDLTNCYRGSGWIIVDRRDLGPAEAGRVDGAYVEAEMSKPTGEYGWLMFGLFDRRGEPIVPPLSGVRVPRLMDRLARNPLIGRLLGRDYMGDLTTTYQVQVFVTDAVGLSPEQRNELQQFFWAVRRRAIEAYGKR